MRSIMKAIKSYFAEYRYILITGLSLALGLFFLSFILYLRFSYMGTTDKEIEEFVFSNYKIFLLVYNLKILIAYLIFAVVTISFSILLGIKRKASLIVFQLFIWFIVWVRGIKLFPQLFKEQLYTRGPLLKGFQIFITDHIPLQLIMMLFPVMVLIIALRKGRPVSGIIIVLFSFIMIQPFRTPAAARPAYQGKPNILVFATDSLRPSGVSYNGYHRRTPNIDLLFSRGINFLNMKSSLARTFSSWTSILTSSLPIDHGIRHMFPQNRDLQKDWRTIVRQFNGSGYHTSVVTDFAGDIFSRIDYGFSSVNAPHLTVKNILKQRSLEMHYFLLGVLINPAARKMFPEMSGMPMNTDPFHVTERAKRNISQAVKAGKPFFAMAFSSNNHFPYATIYPYYSLYENRGYSGDHKYCKGDMMKTSSGYSLPDIERSQVAALYDAASRLFDDNLGDMMDFLRRSGLERDTIIVVMSDHGESLYEEGLGIGHGDHLTGEFSNNMVFGVYSPYSDFKGKRIRETARDIDIGPTLLDMAGIVPDNNYKGISLLPFMRGERFTGLPVYMETGMWYTPETPFIPDRIRVPYPGVKSLVEVDEQTGELVVKEEYESLIIRAKFRAFQFNNEKFIQFPGENVLLEQFFIDEKRLELMPEQRAAFKQRIIRAFNGRFSLSPDGTIIEHSAIADPPEHAPVE